MIVYRGWSGFPCKKPYIRIPGFSFSFLTELHKSPDETDKARSRSLPFKRESDSGHVLLLECILILVVLRGLGRSTVRGGSCYLNLQLKFCLYTIVHLLLQEIRLMSSLHRQSVCQIISPGVPQKYDLFVWQLKAGLKREYN